MASKGVAMNLLVFLSSWIALLGISYSGAQSVPALYVFGDSLLDVGNNNYLAVSVVKANFPHNGVDYPSGNPTGRFSNGKNSADFLAEKVGLPTSPPYLSNKMGVFLQGVNFASGGAGIFNATNDESQSISLAEQVSYYLTVYQATVKELGPDGAKQHFSKSLFAVVIGSNDIFHYFNSGSYNQNKTTPQQYVNLMVSNLRGHLVRLHDLGARKFVISGIATVGCCPNQRNQNKTGDEECNEEANYLSSKYNDGLKSMLQGLQSQLEDISYTFHDSYSIFNDIIQEPGNYGFKEVKAACCGLGNLNADVPCIPISNYCSNRNDHLFWDLYHPTETAARLIIDYWYSGSQQYVTPINVKQLIAV